MHACAQGQGFGEGQFGDACHQSIESHLHAKAGHDRLSRTRCSFSIRALLTMPEGEHQSGLAHHMTRSTIWPK